MTDFQSLKPPASKQKPNTKANNFIESLKDQAKNATLGVGSSAVDQLTSRRQLSTGEQGQPQRRWQYEQMLSREQQVRYRERMLIQQQRQTETLIFSSKEEAAKKEIDVIKQEIKTLVVKAGSLSSELVEAEKAIMGQVPDVKSGTYYLSFFERIRRLIQLAKKKITESRTWLDAFTNRNKSKNYYWGQVKKSGTKFMLSSERQVATQVG